MAVRPDGKIYPCCVYDWKNVPEDLNINHPDPFNHPYLQDLRERMSNDEYIPNCKECYEREEFKQESFRTQVIKSPEFFGTSKDTELTYVDLSISNLCNNKCRMCGPELSTSWYSDAKQLGRHIPRGFVRNPLIDNTDFSKLRLLKLLGGEPLMEQETIKKILRQCDLSQLNVQLITNATLRPDDELFEMMQQLNRIDVKLSVDSYGPLNDFLRSGSTWEETQENIFWFKKNIDKKNLSIHSVASVYNVNKINLMVDFCKMHEIYHDYVLIDGPQWMRPRNLPVHVKQILIEQLRKQDYKFGTKLILELEQSGDTDLFLEQDTIMNQLRNEHWKDVNPELSDLLKFE